MPPPMERDSATPGIFWMRLVSSQSVKVRRSGGEMVLCGEVTPMSMTSPMSEATGVR